jgi:hypothetical protein
MGNDKILTILDVIQLGQIVIDPGLEAVLGWIVDNFQFTQIGLHGDHLLREFYSKLYRNVPD